MEKQTKIVCTIGPSSIDEDILRELIKGGMNVARLNFSHGSHEYHAASIEKIRRISVELEKPIAILQDLQGPKIRVGKLPEEGVVLETDEEIIFTTDTLDLKAKKLPVTYPSLAQDVKPGERILLDDGLLSAAVKEIRGTDVICKVIDGGLLTSSKGVNFPDSELSISAMSDKDREDIAFGVAQGVDMVALSFVRSAKEILDLRYLIRDIEERLPEEKRVGFPIQIIAKIEKGEAVHNIEEILDVVDGIMVARGDLGIEMPAEEVPLIQKKLIDLCLTVSKPVIVATQMLDSMIRNPRPTRAEVSDIANAVIDHTDAVMLSGETASGKYPIPALRTMATVVRQTERSGYDFLPISKELSSDSAQDSVAEVANILARRVKAKLILVGTLSGSAARTISRYRTDLPIYAVTHHERVYRQLNLVWGVTPVLLPDCRSVEELVGRSIAELKQRHIVKGGDRIIVVAGEPVGVSGGINMLEVKEIE